MSSISKNLSEEVERLRDELLVAQRRIQLMTDASKSVVGMRSQEQLAVVFSQSLVAISLNRECDGEYVDVNEEWSRLTGLSLQDVLGRTTIDIGIWTDTRHREVLLDPMRDPGRLRNLDVSFLRPDGEKLILQLNASHIEIGGVAYFLSYLKDVSAERAVQTALLASEQLLKATNNRLNQQIALKLSHSSDDAHGHLSSRTGEVYAT